MTVMSPHGLTQPKSYYTPMGDDLVDGVTPHTVQAGGVVYRCVSSYDSAQHSAFSVGTIEFLTEMAHGFEGAWGFASWGDDAPRESLAMSVAVVAENKFLALVTAASGPTIPAGVLIRRDDVSIDDAKYLAGQADGMIGGISRALGYM